MSEKQTENKYSFFKWLLEVVVVTGIICGIIILLNTYVFDKCTVSGPSMQPSFENGEHVLVLRHAQIKRGDVVVVDAPDEKGALYIKRVIGIPNDKIVSKNNKIYINGRKLNQPWLNAGRKLKDGRSSELYNTKHYADTQNFTIRSLAKSANYQHYYNYKQLKQMQKTNRVPSGTYFVMGDHRSVSKDSRYIGTIRRDKIVGVVKLRYYPINKMQIY